MTSENLEKNQCSIVSNQMLSGTVCLSLRLSQQQILWFSEPVQPLEQKEVDCMLNPVREKSKWREKEKKMVFYSNHEIGNLKSIQGFSRIQLAIFYLFAIINPYKSLQKGVSLFLNIFLPVCGSQSRAHLFLLNLYKHVTNTYIWFLIIP